MAVYYGNVKGAKADVKHKIILCENCNTPWCDFDIRTEQIKVTVRLRVRITEKGRVITAQEPGSTYHTERCC